MRALTWWLIPILLVVIAYAVPARERIAVHVPPHCIGALMTQYVQGWAQEQADGWKADLEQGRQVVVEGCSVAVAPVLADIQLPAVSAPFDAVWEIADSDGESAYVRQVGSGSYRELAGKWLTAMVRGGLTVCPNSTLQPCLTLVVGR